MRAVNIRIATIKKMYEQFVKLERKHIGDTTPGWRWCLSAYCKRWAGAQDRRGRNGQEREHED
jgi:hypothetical protein